MAPNENLVVIEDDDVDEEKSADQAIKRQEIYHIIDDDIIYIENPKSETSNVILTCSLFSVFKTSKT